MYGIVPTEVLLEYCCVCVEVENTALLCLCFEVPPVLDNRWRKTELNYEDVKYLNFSYFYHSITR